MVDDVLRDSGNRPLDGSSTRRVLLMRVGGIRPVARSGVYSVRTLVAIRGNSFWEERLTTVVTVSVSLGH